MGSGLPRRDVGIIIAVAVLLAGGIVTSAVVLPQADSGPDAGAARWFEQPDARAVPPTPVEDPRGSEAAPRPFPLPDARLARQP
jgi:hypothetical protein